MLILLDRDGVSRVAYRTESSEHGDVRRYYAASTPTRAIIVCRNNLELKSLVGQVVDAVLGTEKGWREFVSEGNEGMAHTKVTVFRVANARGGHDNTLSNILTTAPQDNAG